MSPEGSLSGLVLMTTTLINKDSCPHTLHTSKKYLSKMVQMFSGSVGWQELLWLMGYRVGGGKPRRQ